jgi:F-type H+-transporting ATPase subunit delta
MAEATTTARPYAKALFEHALAVKQLAQWSAILQDLSLVLSDQQAKDFIDNPASTVALQADLLRSIVPLANYGEERAVVEHLIALLAQNKRLLLLPEIEQQYQVLRTEQEKTVTAKVSSFTELTSAQEQELIRSLSQRLQRQVVLDVSLDKSLLGGAVIYAGDLVIDGSVRGELNKLGAHLAV